MKCSSTKRDLVLGQINVFITTAHLNMEQLNEYIRKTYEIECKLETLVALDSAAGSESDPVQVVHDLVLKYQNVPDDTVVFVDDLSESDDQ